MLDSRLPSSLAPVIGAAGLISLLGCSADTAPTTSRMREAPVMGAAGASADPAPATVPGTPATGFGNPGSQAPALPPTVPSGNGPALQEGVCEAQRAHANPVTPDMLIVLDRSGSMEDEGRWAPSVDAVRSVTQELGDAIRFGLALFPNQDMAMNGGGLFGGGGASCTPGDVVVPVGDATAGMIGTTLDAATSRGGTPTAETLEAVLSSFGPVDLDPDAVVNPRYVLLVTDGQPTCPAGGGARTTPEDVNRSNAAIDALTQADVQTYVIGYDTAGPERVDLAAVLDGFAQRGGTGDMAHRPVEDAASLIEELRSITASAISCNLALDTAPPAPEYVQVLIDGTQVKLGDADGWEMEGDSVIRLVGAACDTLSDGGEHLLEVSVECQIVE